jgi:hypothetical protein
MKFAEQGREQEKFSWSGYTYWTLSSPQNQDGTHTLHNHKLYCNRQLLPFCSPPFTNHLRHTLSTKPICHVFSSAHYNLPRVYPTFFLGVTLPHTLPLLIKTHKYPSLPRWHRQTDQGQNRLYIFNNLSNWR